MSWSLHLPFRPLKVLVHNTGRRGKPGLVFESYGFDMRTKLVTLAFEVTADMSDSLMVDSAALLALPVASIHENIKFSFAA